VIESIGLRSMRSLTDGEAAMGCEPSWRFEEELFSAGWLAVVGIDEVGRGPLAGPVVAAAIRISPEEQGQLPPGVNDSKKLSRLRREALFEILQERFATAVGVAKQDEIDAINILRASQRAMERAVESLAVGGADGSKKVVLLIDGNQPIETTLSQRTLVRGDQQSYSIAAASIIAKVTRDREMQIWAKRYPDYGFEQNMGYGTRQHIEALKKKGPCPLHRRSFITRVLGEERPRRQTRRESGKYWEERAAEYLEGHGFDVIERSLRNHFGEIDLIARRGSQWRLVEVRSSRSADIFELGEGLSKAKFERIVRTAQAHFLAQGLDAEDLDLHVDVILVSTGDRAAPRMEYIPDVV